MAKLKVHYLRADGNTWCYPINKNRGGLRTNNIKNTTCQECLRRMT